MGDVLIIVMFGAPGVGKGTIADMLKNKYNFEHISAGDLLREEAKKKTKNSKQIAEYTSKGILIPSKIIMKLILNAIKRSNKKNIILDGFPRNIEQAKLTEDAIKINAVLDLKAPLKTILNRLSGRLSCPKCKTIYHVKNLPPKKKGICNNDNEKLIQRNDDKPEVIKDRFKTYKKETQPLEKFFQKQKIIKIIDASDNPKNILKRVEKTLQL